MIHTSESSWSAIGFAVSFLLFYQSTTLGTTLSGSYGNAVHTLRISNQSFSIASSLHLPPEAASPQSGGTRQELPGPPLDSRPSTHTSDPSVVFVLAHVEKQEAAPFTLNGAVYSAGTLFLKVDEVLRPGPLKAGEEFSVPFHQKPPNIKREMDHWNELELGPGTLLLLVCKPSDGDKQWQALSGNNVSSQAEDEQVDTLRGAIRIDAAPSAQEKEESLHEALFGSNDDLADYAARVLTKGEALGKDESARVLASALSSSAMPHERLSRLAFDSMDAFAGQPSPNQAADRLLVAAVARLLVHARSAKERGVYADALVSAFWDSEYHAAYKRLIAGVDDPSASAVEAALQQVATYTRTTPNPRNCASYSALLRLWKESHQGH